MRMRLTGQFKPLWSDKELVVKDGQAVWTPIDQIRLGANGLMPLCSGTGGGVLTRTSIFETIPQPWWQQGQIIADQFWEDIWFYQQARDHGFSVWGDPTVRFGHMSELTIWPHQQPDGSWATVLANGFEGFLVQPWPVVPLEQLKVAV